MNKFIENLEKYAKKEHFKWLINRLNDFKNGEPLTYVKTIETTSYDDTTLKPTGVFCEENAIYKITKYGEDVVNANFYDLLIILRADVLPLANDVVDKIFLDSYDLKVGASIDDFVKTSLNDELGVNGLERILVFNKIEQAFIPTDNSKTTYSTHTYYTSNLNKTFLDKMIISKKDGLFTKEMLNGLLAEIKKDVKTAYEYVKLNRKNVRKL